MAHAAASVARGALRHFREYSAMETLRNLVLSGCLLIVLIVLAPFFIFTKGCQQAARYAFRDFLPHTTYSDSDLHINGVTPAVITIPYSSFLVGGKSVKITSVCHPSQYVLHMPEYRVEAQGPEIFSFNDESSDCSPPRQMRITSVSCTEDPWSPNRPTGHYFTCVEDPSKQTSFTIWEAKPLRQ